MRPSTRAGTRWAAAIGVGVTVIGIGALLTALGRTAADPSAGARSPAGSPAELQAVLGEPIGTNPSVRDGSGAVAAAVTYATAPQDWLYLGDNELTAAVGDLATEAATPRLASDAVGDVRSARAALGASPGRVWWLVRPLAWSVDTFEIDQAEVSVWTVSVLSAEEVAAPQSEWSTVTVDLVWSDGRWQVDGERERPGPTPLGGPGDQPWDAAPFDGALEGFTRIGEPQR